MVLGNARLPHRQAILGFADGLAWLAQIGLFVLLGLLVSPSRLDDALLPALVVGLALVFVARPLSVVGRPRPRSAPGWRDQVFLSWAGLRGAVPIVLATIPLSERMPGRDRLFDAVFVLVVIFTAGAGQHARPGGPLAGGDRPGRGGGTAGGDRAAGADAAPTCCSWTYRRVPGSPGCTSTSCGCRSVPR